MYTFVFIYIMRNFNKHQKHVLFNCVCLVAVFLISPRTGMGGTIWDHFKTILGSISDLTKNKFLGMAHTNFVSSIRIAPYKTNLLNILEIIFDIFEINCLLFKNILHKLKMLIVCRNMFPYDLFFHISIFSKLFICFSPGAIWIVALYYFSYTWTKGQPPYIYIYI